MLKGVFFLSLVALVCFFIFGPEQFDRATNRVKRDIPLPAVSAKALALHKSLFVVDLHADPLLWRRDLIEIHDYGMVDLPRLQKGNVGLQVFGSVTKTPRGQNYDSNPSDSDMITYLAIGNLQPPATWTSLYQRSVYHADKLKDLERRSGGALRVIYSADDLDLLSKSRQAGQPVVGGMLGLEGAQPIEGDIDKLDRLFAAGYRMVGLAHFFDNAVAGSMHGEEKYGLTDLGRQVVSRSEELGMIIDLAHSSNATVADVFDMATKPVVVSHGGVRSVCDANRILTDEQLGRLAANS